MPLSNVNDRLNECHCSSLELVWDEDLDATAVTEQGAPIKVGPAARLSPAHLLALAASSCLMTTLLTLARKAAYRFRDMCHLRASARRLGRYRTSHWPRV
jgi:uncharacterized OsmC-like protein